MKVFASGSCRLLGVLNNGYNIIEPIHSLYYNFIGINFLGKTHNIKQHIQFIQFIKDEISIPQDILKLFLTSYSCLDTEVSKKYIKNYNLPTVDKKMLPEMKDAIKSQFDDCDTYIFEICSLKLYEKDGFQVQNELADDYSVRVQTGDELYADLEILCSLIPVNKKIVFQTHFRPNIIHNDESKAVEKREIIYNTVVKFCDNRPNTYIYDPSELLQSDHTLFDGDVHFVGNGSMRSFEHLCLHYFIKNYEE
jgi:hypothetical protein